MLISIISVYNDEEILNKYLLDSLKDQDVDYELILIDNTQNKFSSAADALNYGGNKAKGDLLFFVHQDVQFFKNNLRQIIDFCSKLDNLGIAGVAGISEKNNGEMVSNILDNIPPSYVSKHKIDKAAYTQTLDEVLLIIPKNIFNKFHFDSKVCYHWHLYGADYCLNIKKEGFDVVILPIELYHASRAGSMSLEYFKTLRNILNKYKNDYDRIYTTCLLGHNPNNQIKLNIFYCMEYLHIRMPLIRFLSKIKSKL